MTLSPLSLLISASLRSNYGRRVNRDTGTEVKGWRAGSVLRRSSGLHLRIWSQAMNPITSRPPLDEGRRPATACWRLIWSEACWEANVFKHWIIGGVGWSVRVHTHTSINEMLSAARDQSDHVYWTMNLTTNTRRSIALMTLRECVKVRMNFMANDDHPLP